MNKTEEKYARQRNASAACSMMRCDECTDRGFKKRIPPYLSAKDFAPCNCMCGHIDSPRIIEYHKRNEIPGWRPYYVKGIGE